MTNTKLKTQVKTIITLGTSLVAQCLGLHAPSAGGPGSITGPGSVSHMHAAARSSHAATKEPASCSWGALLPQLRSPHAATGSWEAGEPQLRSPTAATETRSNQMDNK